MGNPNLLSYETIVRATSGEPEAVDEVLRHYRLRWRLAACKGGFFPPRAIMMKFTGRSGWPARLQT